LWDLTPEDLAGVLHGIGAISVSPDGCSYAYTFARDLSELYLADGLK